MSMQKDFHRRSALHATLDTYGNQNATQYVRDTTALPSSDDNGIYGAECYPVSSAYLRSARSGLCVFRPMRDRGNTVTVWAAYAERSILVQHVFGLGIVRIRIVILGICLGDGVWSLYIALCIDNPRIMLHTLTHIRQFG